MADKRGLVLPDDSQELRTFFALLDGDNYVGVAQNYEGWRIEDSAALSVMALAQHYGLPARLLDWTLAPYIAAFFAGYDVYKNSEKYDYDGTLVVWAFYFPSFERQTRYTPASYIVRSVTAPSATNVNLKAQQGVFTLVNSENTGELDGKYLPFDEILESSPYKEKADLTKFTLPVSEARSLLYLLARLDITPSSIYPGYASIVSDLKMLLDGDVL